MITRFASLSGVILNLIDGLNLQEEMTLYQLAKHWGEIVGPQIAAHTIPERLRFDTLSLSVDSAPWMNQLTFFKKEIVNNTNKFLSKRQIQNVMFRSAPRMTPPPQKEIATSGIANQKTPLMPAERMAMEEALKGLHDIEVRKKITTAITGYFKVL